MKAKLVKETLYEYGGAGFAYGGGSSIFPSNRGGQSNRGGFGGAANLGGPNMMYTYEIKPLNKTLQPEIYGEEGIENIHIGSDISGYEMNKKDGKLHVGTVMSVVKSDNGSLNYYIILDPNTSIKMKIDPTTALLISKLDGVDPIQGDQLLNKEDSELLKGEIMGSSNKDKTLKAKLVKESLNNQNIKDDANNLLVDLINKNIITSGYLTSTGYSALGKNKLFVKTNGLSFKEFDELIGKNYKNTNTSTSFSSNIFFYKNLYFFFYPHNENLREEDGKFWIVIRRNKLK